MNADNETEGLRKGLTLSTPARFGLIALMFLLIAVFILIEKTCITRHEKRDLTAAYARFLEPFDAPSPPEQTLRPIARRGNAERPSVQTRTYRVKRGDSLGHIAAKMLGSSRKWKRIAKLNGIDNPRRLRAGRVLKIPASE